jgi:hypothetical protein
MGLAGRSELPSHTKAEEWETEMKKVALLVDSAFAQHRKRELNRLKYIAGRRRWCLTDKIPE